MKTIEITFAPSGATKVETKGFAGSSCQQASKFIEEALGEKVSDIKKAEFFQPEPAVQRQQQH